MIPKKIHQIGLGDLPLPTSCIEQSGYKLWTTIDLISYNICKFSESVIESLILYNEGGLYFDIDLDATNKTE